MWGVSSCRNVDYFNAHGSFVDSHTIEALSKDGNKVMPLLRILNYVADIITLPIEDTCSMHSKYSSQCTCPYMVLLFLTGTLVLHMCLQMQLTSEHFVLAVGGRPKYPDNVRHFCLFRDS